MRRNILVVVMLVMMLPTFGQKLNSRGEKMVGSVYEYERGTKLINTISFNYGKDGALSSISCNGRQIKKDKKDFIFYGWREQGETPKYETTVDINGHITSLKVITTLTDKSGVGYDLYENKYEYITDLNKYTIVADSVSTWYQFTGKNPIQSGDLEHRCTSYIYGPCNMYKKGYERKEGKMFFDNYEYCVSYSDESNTCNISVLALLLEGKKGSERGLLDLTEWCPFYTLRLPKAVKNGKNDKCINFFEYDYYDNSVVGIRVYSVGSLSNPNTKNLVKIYKINYVED